VWRDESKWDIYARRIQGCGVLAGPDPIYLAQGTQRRQTPSVAYDPVHDRYLVVWAYYDGAQWDLHGRFVPWEDSIPALPEFEIHSGATGQDVRHPKVVYSRGQEEFLVVWVNTRGAVTGSDILGRRVKADGSGFASSAWPIADSVEYQDMPAVAYSGPARNQYLVLWSRWTGSNWDVYGVRLDHVGSPVGGGAFAIATTSQGDSFPAVAACNDADQYLVVWERDFSATDFGIYGLFLSGTGVAGAEFDVYDTGSLEAMPDVACCAAGAHYLVTWHAETGIGFGVWARPVATNGSKGADLVVAEPVPGWSRDYASVAGGSPRYLVAWQHDRDGTAYQDIHGRLVAAYAVHLPLVLRSAP
jgi:hypothetical protein